MEPFIGTVTMFGGNFAPRGWAFCQGQLLPIASYTALFSILGTTYGGDGRTTFGLPDLRGRVAVGEGAGPGLSNVKLGEKAGSERTTLTVANLPQDAKVNVPASSEDADSDEPSGKAPAVTSASAYHSGSDENMFGATIDGAANTAYNNLQPVLSSNYIIALQGTFPSRS